jgi:hypothetical protein
VTAKTDTDLGPGRTDIRLSPHLRGTSPGRRGDRGGGWVTAPARVTLAPQRPETCIAAPAPTKAQPPGIRGPGATRTLRARRPDCSPAHKHPARPGFSSIDDELDLIRPARTDQQQARPSSADEKPHPVRPARADDPGSAVRNRHLLDDLTITIEYTGHTIRAAPVDTREQYSRCPGTARPRRHSRKPSIRGQQRWAMTRQTQMAPGPDGPDTINGPALSDGQNQAIRRDRMKVSVS